MTGYLAQLRIVNAHLQSPSKIDLLFENIKKIDIYIYMFIACNYIVPIGHCLDL